MLAHPVYPLSKAVCQLVAIGGLTLCGCGVAGEFGLLWWCVGGGNIGHKRWNHNAETQEWFQNFETTMERTQQKTPPCVGHSIHY